MNNFALLVGYSVIIYFVLHILFKVFYPLICAISFIYCLIRASFVNKVEIKWHVIPEGFVGQYWKFLRCGVPDSMHNKYLEWNGVFDFKIKRVNGKEK